MKKQLNFFDYHNLKDTKKKYGRTIHGGATTKGHRKLERPLSVKKPIHLILKSEKAKGKLSFLSIKNKIYVENLIREKAKKFGVKIHDFANVGNHLHIKISIQSRDYFQKFLKSVTALIARHITGAKKGNKFGKFWQGLAFTRVLTSHLEELYLRGYFVGNHLEVSPHTKTIVSEGLRNSAIDSVAGGVKNHFQKAPSTSRELFLKQFSGWVYRERLRVKHLPFKWG